MERSEKTSDDAPNVLTNGRIGSVDEMHLLRAKLMEHTKAGDWENASTALQALKQKEMKQTSLKLNKGDTYRRIGLLREEEQRLVLVSEGDI